MVLYTSTVLRGGEIRPGTESRGMAVDMVENKALQRIGRREHSRKTKYKQDLSYLTGHPGTGSDISSCWRGTRTSVGTGPCSEREGTGGHVGRVRLPMDVVGERRGGALGACFRAVEEP